MQQRVGLRFARVYQHLADGVADDALGIGFAGCLRVALNRPSALNRRGLVSAAMPASFHALALAALKTAFVSPEEGSGSSARTGESLAIILDAEENADCKAALCQAQSKRRRSRIPMKPAAILLPQSHALHTAENVQKAA